MDSVQEFDIWLISMDDKLEKLLSEIPQEVAPKLDYSPASLTVLEQWLLKTYPTLEALLQFDRYFFDRLCCYVGETIRLNAEAKWSIDFSRSDDVFHGLPVVAREGKAPRCPYTLVGAAMDRRRGDLMEKAL